MPGSIDVYNEQPTSYDVAKANNPDASVQSSSLDTQAASLVDSFESGPIDSIARSISRDINSTPTLSGQDLQKYNFQGLTPDLSIQYKPTDQVPEFTAQQQYSLMQQRNKDAVLMNSRPQTWTGFGASVSGSFAGTMVDPINFASSIIPVAAPVKALELAGIGLKAAGAADAASVAFQGADLISNSKIASQALQGAAGAALVQPILLANSDVDHANYSFQDAAQNILYGGLFGVGAGTFERGLEYLKSGSAGSGIMRSAAATAEAGHSFPEDASQDMLAATPDAVKNDLTESLGRSPTPDEVNQESANRTEQFQEKLKTGQYDTPIEPINPNPQSIEAPHLIPDDAMEDLANGNYQDAASKMDAVTAKMDADPMYNSDPAVVKEANAPVEQAKNLSSIIQDFVSCVTNSFK